MRKLFLLPLLAALLLASPSAYAATKTVSITKSGFVPNAVAIDQGDSVTWTNSDDRNRQPVSQSAGFAAPILKPGETFTYTFKDAGTFTVRDALVANQSSRVTVNKAAPLGSPSLAASRQSVIFGGSLVLTGKVPSDKAGEKVTLRAETMTASGSKQTSSVAETSTTADGSFRFVHAPTAQTTYTVAWLATPATSTTSDAVTVTVAPRLGVGIVRKLSGRRVMLSTKATSAISYAGHSAFVQRRTRFGEWVSIKRVVLRGGPFATRTTVRLPKGLSRIRVLLPKSQAGTGYTAGTSRTLLIVR
jgi:hypothetical protein